jgi:hypothetical protein
MYGIAVDDAHTFKAGNPVVAGPDGGGSWSAPNASEARAILQALEDGRFYADRRRALRRRRHRTLADRHGKADAGEPDSSSERAAALREASKARPFYVFRGDRGTSGPK